MRFKEPFTLYTRTSTEGKKVYYYRTYTPEGKRIAYSTGKSTKAAAKEYCFKLYKSDQLLPNKTCRISFTEYSANWWIWDKCDYICGIIARGGSFSRSFADICRINLNKHILPVFGKKVLKEITASQIDSWLLSFTNKGLSNTTANHCFKVLRIMLTEAERKGLITSNPARTVKPLKENHKERGILTTAEVRKLLAPEYSKLYWNNSLYYAGNLLAAVTGMRQGEIMALKSENVFTDHVSISFSKDKKYGLKDTKTHNSREVPIPQVMAEILADIKPSHPDGFIFSLDGGRTTFDGNKLKEALYTALLNIGIQKDEREKRNITFHSWRHFFNTALRSGGIADSKTQKLTGHKTAAMTEHYTHFNLQDFSDVKTLQETLVTQF